MKLPTMILTTSLHLASALPQQHLDIAFLSIAANDTTNPIAQTVAQILPADDLPSASVSASGSFPHLRWTHFGLGPSTHPHTWPIEQVLAFIDRAITAYLDARADKGLWDEVPRQKWRFDDAGLQMEYWIRVGDEIRRPLVWYDVSVCLYGYRGMVEWAPQVGFKEWKSYVFDYEVEGGSAPEAFGGFEYIGDVGGGVAIPVNVS